MNCRTFALPFSLTGYISAAVSNRSRTGTSSSARCSNPWQFGGHQLEAGLNRKEGILAGGAAHGQAGNVVVGPSSAAQDVVKAAVQLVLFIFCQEVDDPAQFNRHP
jgi:hypothetical protein